MNSDAVNKTQKIIRNFIMKTMIINKKILILKFSEIPQIFLRNINLQIKKIIILLIVFPKKIVNLTLLYVIVFNLLREITTISLILILPDLIMENLI